MVCSAGSTLEFTERPWLLTRVVSIVPIDDHGWRRKESLSGFPSQCMATSSPPSLFLNKFAYRDLEYHLQIH
jgi:hypothetical protein